MLSQTAEYALRAMLYLAKRPTATATARDIARATHVPASYLPAILRALARAGLVRAQRGKKGGFTLAAEPAQISLYEVVQAVDPLRRISLCPRLSDVCPRLCPLHRFLDDQIARFQEALGSIDIGRLSDGAERVLPPVS